MKLIFSLSAGRTGTRYLAKLLHQNISDAEVHHEILSFESFGVDTPDVSHMHAFNVHGNNAHLQEFWTRKFKKILASSKACYVETSHLLMKVGLIENAASIAASGHELHFVILTRNYLDTMLSYHQRFDFLNKGNIWLWYLDPEYPRNMLTAKALFPEMGIHGLRLWYLNEIAVRSENYRRLYSTKANMHFHTFDVDGLNTPQGADALLKALKLPAENIKLPPKQNVGAKQVMIPDGEIEFVKKLIADNAINPQTVVDGLLRRQGIG